MARPSRPVLQPVATTAPFKKPVDAIVPKGGPRLPQGLPPVPGDPTAGGKQGSGGDPPASGVRGMVDANTLHTTTSYDNPQTKGYETDVGQGPTVDIRPSTPGTPEGNTRSTGRAKNAT